MLILEAAADDYTGRPIDELDRREDACEVEA